MINKPENSIHSSTDFSSVANVPVENKENPLHDSLKKLARIGTILRTCGVSILVGTIVNIGISISIFAHIRISASFEVTSQISALSAMFALVFATSYDMLRRQGDAVFEEVSDELQWRIQSKTGTATKQKAAEDSDVAYTPKPKYANERPELNVRITLRTYARTSELPFIPGKYGAVSYVLINLFVVIFNGIYAYRVLNPFVY